ncbi:MAG: T9SS type A sorting domain-containing protein [Chlorobiales bacterium]|nr:T9SS type A sorting domain-containing protein [Chlorobiales bacterium]
MKKIIFLILSFLFLSGVIQAQLQAQSNPQIPKSLQELLNPDGSPKLKTGFKGSFNPSKKAVVNPIGNDDLPIPMVAEDENWESGFGLPGVDGSVYAVAVSGTTVYISGLFTVVNGITVNNIAKWDGNQWSALGSGVSGYVNALAVDMEGNLYAGGSFTTASGVTVNNIAKWDGNQWRALGSGTNGPVSALAVDLSGNLYVGGNFLAVNGISMKNIAKWDGSGWSALGSGVDGHVDAVAVDGSGNVYAGGSFATASGVTVNNIAKWDGNEWSAMGGGTNAGILALATDGSGNVYAGGSFTTAGITAANRIAKWNGVGWSSLAGGMAASVSAVTIDGTGILYAGGNFTEADGTTVNGITKWDGTHWRQLSTGMSYAVSSLAADANGVLYAGGYFATAGSVSASGIAKWNGSAWDALVNEAPLIGMNNYVHALALDKNGNMIVGGDFITAGLIPANYISNWNGTNWSTIGSGVSATGTSTPYILDLSIDNSNNVFAGGSFSVAGATNASCVAKWNGSSWSALGSGISGGASPYVSAVKPDGNGNLYAGGSFTTAGTVSAKNVAKWNGSAWSALGNGVDGNVNALALDAGNAYAGGSFTTASSVTVNNIARWDGANWNAMGTGMTNQGTTPAFVSTIVTDNSGNVYVAGQFKYAGGVTVNNIAKWNGSSWGALGSGMNGRVDALLIDGSGTLYAGGNFTTAGGNTCYYIAKWNGSSWSALGSGMNGRIDALALDKNGNLYIGGGFTKAGGKSSSYIARWNTTPKTVYTGQSSETQFNLEVKVLNPVGIVPAISFENMVPLYGALPNGIQNVSYFYWNVTGSVTFSSGVISVPVADLVGVTNPKTLVWLKRPDSQGAWTNIGGTINNGRLESTVPFNSFSEFAIGSRTDENILDVKEDEPQKAYDYTLSQNYPNPFNPTTTIRFSMRQPGAAKLTVYDVLGRLIVSRQLQANRGWNEYRLDGAGMSTGMYFYRLSVAGKYEKTLKMLLVK